MTRRLAALFAALALLAGCSSGTEPEPGSDNGAGSESTEETVPGGVEETARDLMEALAGDGDPGPMVELFSADVAAQLPEETLVEVWEQTIEFAGEYEGTIDTTSRDADGRTAVTVTSGFSRVNVQTDLQFSDDGEIHGVWFTYADNPASLHPDPPELPEGTTEVEIAVGEHELPGILTLPDSDGPNAVVLLVAGSGPQNMDGTVGSAGNAVLRDIAYQLAEHGVPTLRYDKRFYVRPELGEGDITIEDEVIDDAVAAVELLREREELADYSIVIGGHSLGGMLLPEIVEQSDADGGVILAGTARTLWDVIGDQNEAMIESAIDDGSMSEQEAAFSLMYVRSEVERANEMTEPEGEAVLGSMSPVYVVSLNTLDLPGLASELEIPLLVVQGTDDFQILAGADYESWQPVLAENPDVTYRLFEGLNHFFMPEVEDMDVTDYNVPSAVDPEVTDTIAEWLDERW